ncbi:MAG: AraC family transcriptional regulator ligand-binding domain-containing protein [Gemmatimonadaceae bacterium]|nr:AraC family transcriptional regulator ligand-binding domain-containing protein [Gemmatimonadaceae bacterium]
MTAGTIDMIASTVVMPDITRVPTASTTYLQGVVDFALTRGVSRRALLHRAGVSESDLSDLDARHPVTHLIALLRAGADLEQDPAFALHFGQYVPCDQVSLAAPLGRSAKTVVEALALVNRYTPLSLDFPALLGANRYRFARTRAGLWLCDERPADEWPEITELVFSRMVQGIRRIQQTDVVRAVYVRHAAPAYRTTYEDIFGVPVHFASGQNAILLDPSYEFTELVPGPSHVTRVLAQHADAQLVALAQQRSCRGRLESELRALLHTGEVNIAHVARRLAMSRQTLYRRLKSEGVTYEHVLETLRCEIATAALHDEGVSVREVALRVGFADATAFSRAFKRWTGRSPSTVARPPHA